MVLFRFVPELQREQPVAFADRKIEKHIFVCPFRLSCFMFSNRYAPGKRRWLASSIARVSSTSSAKGHRRIVELKLHISHSSDFSDGYSRNRDSFEFLFGIVSNEVGLVIVNCAVVRNCIGRHMTEETARNEIAFSSDPYYQSGSRADIQQDQSECGGFAFHST